MRKIAVLCVALLSAFGLMAQDKTLRVDYIFSGTDKTQEIALDEMSCFDGWAGRRVNPDSVPVRGNGQISLTDKATGEILYRQSFSTLFQEWQTTEEATQLRKAFENVFLLPMPSAPAEIKVELYDFKGNVSASLIHTADPSDILIRHIDPVAPPHKYMFQSGSPQEKIDVAVVAEGYTAEESELFYEDARKEFSLSMMTGFGADGDEEQRKEDFMQVRGSFFEADPFVTSVRDHIRIKSELGDRVLDILSRC